MEAILYKAEIEKTFTNVRTFSYSEKKANPYDEEHINAFLDAIN